MMLCWWNMHCSVIYFPAFCFYQDEQRLLEAIAGVLHVCDISFAPNEEGSVITNPHKVQLGTLL